MNAYSPKSLEELTQLLEQFSGNVLFVAGGTDLIIQLRHTAYEPENLVYLGQIPELKTIKKYGEGLLIGAACTMSWLSEHPMLSGAYRVLAEAADSVGSVQVRNRATIGGNIAHASAAADMAAPLLCLNADAVVLQSGRKSKIPVSELIVGNEKTILGAGDVILGFFLPSYTGQTVSHYHKLAFRKEMSISRFGIAVMIQYAQEAVEQASVCIGAIGPKAVRMPEVEELIIGKPLTESAIEEAGQLLSAYIGATSGRKYKMWAAGSVMEDALRPFMKRQQGNGAE